MTQKDQQNVPKLRFPGFEGVWEAKKVSDVFRITRGQVLAVPKMTQEPTEGSKYPVYSSQTKNNGLTGYYSEYLFEDAVTWTTDGANAGDVRYRSGKFYCTNVCGVLLSDEGFASQFASESLNRITHKYVSYVGNPKLMNNVMGGIQYHLPTLPEQRKIASFLGSVDRKIAQLSQKKALIEDYKKGCMQQLFSQKIRFKDDNGKDFPDWEEKRLGEVLSIGSGRDYKHLGKGEIPVYGTGGLMTYVDDYLYDGESVCIGRKGTIDKPALIEGKFWTVDTLFYTHSFTGALPRFIYAIFQQVNWQMHNEASGVPSLSKSTIERLKISLPDPDEQRKIAEFLSAIDRKIELVGTELEHARAFKKGLLQQMFV